MRANLALGLAQGIFVPHPRPDRAGWPSSGRRSTRPTGARGECDVSLGDVGGQCGDRLARARYRRRQVPPDRRQSEDACRTAATNGRRPWRSCGWCSRTAAFAVHDPVPPAFGDEGAANHMRLAPAHGEPGVEVFVYGVSGGAFPARQHVEASKAIARLHRLDPERTLFAAAVGGSDRRRRVPQRRRRGRQRARAVRARAGVRRQAGVDRCLRAAGAGVRICRGRRGRRAARRRGQLLFVQCAAGHAAGRAR